MFTGGTVAFLVLLGVTLVIAAAAIRWMIESREDKAAVKTEEARSEELSKKLGDAAVKLSAAMSQIEELRKQVVILKADARGAKDRFESEKKRMEAVYKADLDQMHKKYFSEMEELRSRFTAKMDHEREKHQQEIEDLKDKHRQAVDEARKDAARRSRAVTKGKGAERVIPVSGEWPYAPRDCRFLGDPIDFVVFNGYSDIRDHSSQNGELEIIFVELKTTSAKTPRVTSRSERAIRDAIRDGRVKWVLCRASGGNGEGISFDVVQEIRPGRKAVQKI